MHLQDGPQLDLSAQVAKVRAKARPWKSIIALVFAIIAAVVSAWARRGYHHFFTPSSVASQASSLLRPTKPVTSAGSRYEAITLPRLPSGESPS